MMKTIGQFLLHLIGSIINVSSDAINSLDMIGLNVSGKVEEGLSSVKDGLIDGIKLYGDLQNNNVTTLERPDIIWGSVGLSLVFLPGVPLLITYGCGGSIKETLVGVASFLCFPFALITIRLLSVFGSGEEFLASFVTVEAIFQCFPQLVLQFFVLINDYPLTPVIIITIVSSSVVLLKNVIVSDKESVEFDDWLAVITYSLKIFPIYISVILFRVGCYSLLLAYLRFWAFIPIVLLIIELWVFGKLFIDYSSADALMASVMNMGMINMGKRWRDTDVNLSIKMAWHGKWNLTRDMRFIKWSAVIIFLHLSLTMIILILMVNMNPELMHHWQDLTLHPTSCDKLSFNGVCGSILVCGMVHLLLLRF